METIDATAISETNNMDQSDFEEARERAFAALGRDDLIAAQAEVTHLKTFSALTKSQGQFLVNIEREFNQKRAQRVSQLEQAIRTGLSKATLSEEDATTLQRLLAELEQIDPTNSALASWSARLAEMRNRSVQEEKIREIETELQQRWQQAATEEAKGLYGASLISIYSNALEYVRGQEALYQHPSMTRLLQNAEDRLRNFREKHDIASTRQLTGEFKALLSWLEQQPRDEIVAIIRDPFAPEPEVRTRSTPMRAEEARALVERQARDFAAQKAADYRSEALRHLEEHNPESAKERVQAVLDLFGLDGEQKAITNNLLTSQVEPALQKRNEAKQVLEDAKKLANPRRRWDKLSEVEQMDAYVPGLSAERTNLVPSLQKQLDEQLDAVEMLLAGQPPKWQAAHQQLVTLRPLTEQDLRFEAQADRSLQLERAVEAWQQVANEIQQAIQDAERMAQTNPKQALAGLLARRTAWGERADRYPALGICQAGLEAQTEASNLLAQLELSLHDTELPEVDQALAKCKAAIEANPPQLADFRRMSSRLQLHRSYLLGAALLRKVRRTTDDEEQGVDLLRGVVDQKGDDSSAAQSLLAQVGMNRELADKRKQAITKAGALVQQKNYAAAYKELQPYGNDSAAAALFGQIAEAWEGVLIDQVSQHLAKNPLNEPVVKKLVADLDTVGSAEARALKRMVYSRCAEQRAHSLQARLPIDWKAVQEAWQEALEYEPENFAFQQQQRAAAKRLEYGRIDALGNRSEKIETLRGLVDKYPADLDVRQWHLAALVDEVQAETDYFKLEDAAQRIEDALTSTYQLALALGVDTNTRQLLDRTRAQVDRLRTVARRKYQVELALRPDKLLDAWQRARKEADTLLRENETDRGLHEWWRKVSYGASQEAAARLQAEKGKGIWSEMQPAAQMLTLDPDNATAKGVIQRVYRAIIDLPARLRQINEDTTGASYLGEPHEKLDNQIDAAQELRQSLYFGQEILVSFGGLFENASELRGQVNQHIAQVTALVGRLEQVRRYVNQAHSAIDQARDNENFWHAYEDALKQITEKGFGQHMTVVELDKVKKMTQEKQRHLRTLRENLEREIQAGQVSDALRFAEQMTGMPAAEIRDGKQHMSATVVDPRADPTDDYGEQRRIQVVDPFTKRRLTNLQEIVRRLLEQQEQVDQLRAWLPSVPTPDGIRTETPIVAWDDLRDEFDAFLRAAQFADARQLINAMINGNEQGKYGDNLALQAAIQHLSNPPLTEQALQSQQAHTLWMVGQDLLRQTKRQLVFVQAKSREIDRWETDWDDAYRRFQAEFTRLGELKASRGIIFGLGKNAEFSIVRTQAREALNRCLELCPEYPGLADFNSSPLLGG